MPLSPDELDKMLAVLAKHGVRHFKSPDLEVSLAAPNTAGPVERPIAPPKDDAMPSDEEMMMWSAGGGADDQPVG